MIVIKIENSQAITSREDRQETPRGINHKKHKKHKKHKRHKKRRRRHCPLSSGAKRHNLSFTPKALDSKAQGRKAHPGLPINQMFEPQRGSTKGASLPILQFDHDQDVFFLLPSSFFLFSPLCSLSPLWFFSFSPLSVISVSIRAYPCNPWLNPPAPFV